MLKRRNIRLMAVLTTLLCSVSLMVTPAATLAEKAAENNVANVPDTAKAAVRGDMVQAVVKGDTAQAATAEEVRSAEEEAEQAAAEEAVEKNTNDSQYEYKTGGGFAVTGQLSGVGYDSKLYDATSGLPTSDANYILGASDGYIWIGGYSGILRYDGTNFEKIETNKGLTSGRALFEDTKGRIWVGTNDNGIVVIDDKKTTHITYKDGLPSSSMRCFAEDNNGNIYVATTAGVCYVDANMKVHIVDDKRINNERVLKVVSDAAGNIYGQTNSGIIFAVDGDSVSELYRSKDLDLEPISTILPSHDKPGMFYICTDSCFVYYGEFGALASNMKRISVAPAGNIHWISYDCGRVWVSSTSMIGYLDESNNFVLVKNLPMNSAIEMMTSDYQGNMWFASSTQGVMKIVTSGFSDLNEEAELPKRVVNATCLLDDFLYMGTDEGLMVVKKNTYKHVYDDLTQFLGNSRIRCILKDKKGNLWVATYTNDYGLVCQKPDGSIEGYTVLDGMPSNEIRSLYEREDGSILVGTNGGMAIIKDGKIVDKCGAEEGIKNTVFLTVAEGENGEVYAGSDGDGIYIIKDDKVERIGRDEGLTSDVVLKIKKDKDRNLYWIITSNSIEYYKDGKITNVTSFPFNNNYDAYLDNTGNLWILSSYGIYSVKADDMVNDSVKDYKLYTVANGLPGIPTSNSYSSLDTDGNLYVSGRKGVIKINIDNYYDQSSKVKLGVSSIQFGDKAVLPEGENHYEIPSGNERIQIMPAVLDYTMSDPTVHVYLEGSGDNGITVKKSKLTALEYTSLKYGNYKLHIQIVDDNTGNVIQDEIFDINKSPEMSELLATRIMVIVIAILIIGFIIWRVLNGRVMRKQYEQVTLAKAEAERSNTAKSRFLANISHEIRAPINIITGMDEMILRENSEGVPKEYLMSVVNYAMNIKSASKSLVGLVNDILDISKIESGKMELSEYEYDTRELLASIITMIRFSSTRKNLGFDVDIDESVPKRMYGDAGKIKQILLNLLSNALKYTEEGGFSLKLVMEEKSNDRCKLKFSVKDTGIGIKKEDLNKLFMAYERLDEEKNRGVQGTGLGLDISRRFAELLGGAVWCESEYGKGSEFFFTLEQKIVDREGIGEFVEDTDNTALGIYVPQFIAPDASVLVVDDNPKDVQVVQELLKATKVFVSVAESGEECLEKVKYGRYDVVLMDHFMPGMNGIETVARIREDNPDLPIYALTANSADSEDYYISIGFNGYIAKPIDAELLERTVLKHLPESIVLTKEENERLNPQNEYPEGKEWLKNVEGIDNEVGIKPNIIIFTSLI